MLICPRCLGKGYIGSNDCIIDCYICRGTGYKIIGEELETDNA